MLSERSLDDWYRTINAIYLDRNFYRSLESIYLHFIEVAASLNTAGETSRKKHIVAEDFLPKTIAWFFALCGRAGIPSVEKMMWAKFPNVCPYCRLPTHLSMRCKENDPSRSEVDWNELKVIANRDRGHMPRTLAQWQQMFNRIYPRDENTKHELNIKRLGEELGETAEAIRILPVATQYIICEAPDIFAWLMGFANQFDVDRKTPEKQIGRYLEQRIEKAYPDGCVECGFSICKCPAILPSTIGRISKEGPRYQIFEHKRGLFSIEESVQFFGRALQGIKIGNQQFDPERKIYKQFEIDLATIIEKLDSLNAVGGQTLVSLTHVLSQLEVLAKQGSLVQADVDKLIAFVEAQPSKVRSIIVNFLVNLSASGAFGAMTLAVTEVLKALTGS